MQKLMKLWLTGNKPVPRNRKFTSYDMERVLWAIATVIWLLIVISELTK
jgi:hypothetical protein